ncbi:hypothetical protein DM860_010041 [Cuscuta australis]|uniref:protein-serine/threonine phosphatase n=1 Tax=Cuscuta australis TaxID=267555 RepID=A0A328D610_9ASTE|nr:hypothetical protein DM860_010041 [Cuscuta australis]
MLLTTTNLYTEHRFGEACMRSLAESARPEEAPLGPRLGPHPRPLRPSLQTHPSRFRKRGDDDDQQKPPAAGDGDTHLLDGGALVLKLRPGVRSFLEKASAMFDLSIYTMGTRHYADQVAGRLVRHASHGGGGGLSFVKVISREDCTVERQKGLDVVPSHRRAVLVVDDKAKVWAMEDRDHVLTIAPYYFFGRLKGEEEDEEEDKGELSRVLGVLREVHSRFFQEGDGDRDAAQILKRVRSFVPYHGPPDVSSLLHRRRRRRRVQEEEKEEEEGRGDDWSKIKKIKIVFRSGTCGLASPPPIATTTTATIL